MGNENTISATAFPKQGMYLGKQVRVCFEFDTIGAMYGFVVRDDAEHPLRMIIRLNDGRFVLSTECQWQPM
jgi:hypothetical protein